MTRVERRLWWLCVLNFVAFVVSDMVLGGGAFNGKVDGQHYLRGSHGHFVEVSHGVFLFSLIHTISFFATCFIGAIVSMIARYRINDGG